MCRNSGIEFKLIFVSSPEDEQLDQELDDSMIAPIPSGINTFAFEAIPPDPTKIPNEDILGVAALIVTGSYKNQEFIRFGYYQNTGYDNEEMRENPPDQLDYAHLIREISNKPRVTRFNIQW
jgi:histone chaperone ASF1